jgi:putative ABC transport system permease protein
LGLAPSERLSGLPGVAVPAVKARKRRGRIMGSLVTVMETFRLAIDALRAHKLRSFLTLLGVILAVATLVAVMSVVAGLNFYVAAKVANLGANVYLVDRFGIITSQDAWIKAQKRPLLSLDEFDRLRDNMKTAANVAATSDRVTDVRSGNILLENTELTGVTPNYADIRNMNLSAGRFLTEGDELHHAPV